MLYTGLYQCHTHIYTLSLFTETLGSHLHGMPPFLSEDLDSDEESRSYASTAPPSPSPTPIATADISTDLPPPPFPTPAAASSTHDVHSAQAAVLDALLGRPMTLAAPGLPATELGRIQRIQRQAPMLTMGSRQRRAALYDTREVVAVFDDMVLDEWSPTMPDDAPCLVLPVPAEPLRPLGIPFTLPFIVERAAQGHRMARGLAGHLGTWTLPDVLWLLYGMSVFGAGSWARICADIFKQEGCSMVLRDKYRLLYRGGLVCSCTAYRDPRLWHAVCKAQIQLLIDRVLDWQEQQ